MSILLGLRDALSVITLVPYCSCPRGAGRCVRTYLQPRGPRRNRDLSSIPQARYLDVSEVLPADKPFCDIAILASLRFGCHLPEIELQGPHKSRGVVASQLQPCSS